MGKNHKTDELNYAINVIFTKESRDALAKLAKEDERPLSNYCRIILTKHLERVKNQMDKSYNIDAI